jgi:hypothetical protein
LAQGVIGSVFLQLPLVSGIGEFPVELEVFEAVGGYVEASGGEDQARHAGPVAGGQTHGARFAAAVQDAVFEQVPTQRGTRSAQCHDLGLGGRVPQLDDAAGTFPNLATDDGCAAHGLSGHVGQHLRAKGAALDHPRLGRHRLDRLQPEHLDAFYTWLAGQGLKPNTILQIHRILSRALKVAWKRGKTGHNVAMLVDAPVGEESDIEALQPRKDHNAQVNSECAGQERIIGWAGRTSMRTAKS